MTMRFSLPNAVLAALSLFLLADRLSAEAYNDTTRIDCYSEVPGYKNNGTYTWQTDGYCQGQCVKMGYPVMALHDGLECLCGDEIPPNATKTTGCDSACSGFPSHLCGGKSAYEVFLTGTTPTVAVMGEESASSSSSSSTTTAPDVSVITKAGQTIVVTASNQPSTSSKSGGGVNTAGIAAGVVVGVVALSVIIGAAFFFLRRKRARKLEGEYRRNAEISAFAQKKPNTPSSDSRWDGDYMAQRRQSNGSIDDDQDFSRRILTVTNPDGRL